MKILKTVMLGLMLVLTIPHQTRSDTVLPVTVSEVEAKEEAVDAKPQLPLTSVQLANKYALQYGINPQVFTKVMLCESGGQPIPRGYNDGGRAYGIMQFHKPTFEFYAKKMGEKLDYKSHSDQLKLAAYMFSIKQQGHWTCYKKVVRV